MIIFQNKTNEVNQCSVHCNSTKSISFCCIVNCLNHQINLKVAVFKEFVLQKA